MHFIVVNFQDSLNACVTLAIPTGIFEHMSPFESIDHLISGRKIKFVIQDILPNPEGFTKDFDQCAIRTDVNNSEIVLRKQCILVQSNCDQ